MTNEAGPLKEVLRQAKIGFLLIPGFVAAMVVGEAAVVWFALFLVDSGLALSPIAERTEAGEIHNAAWVGHRVECLGRQEVGRHE